MTTTTTFNQTRLAKAISYTVNTDSGYITHIQWKSKKVNLMGHPEDATYTYGETSLGEEPSVLCACFIPLGTTPPFIPPHKMMQWTVFMPEDYTQSTPVTPTLEPGQTLHSAITDMIIETRDE